MDFKNGVKNIQAVAYNGTHMVIVNSGEIVTVAGRTC